MHAGCPVVQLFINIASALPQRAAQPPPHPALPALGPRYLDAVADCFRAEERDPSYARLYHRRADAYCALGAYDTAEQVGWPQRACSVQWALLCSAVFLPMKRRCSPRSAAAAGPGAAGAAGVRARGAGAAG